MKCRACRSTRGDLVLDLGRQPASDHFPDRSDPGPDPVYPLQMWLCSACGLAQLVEDPTVPEEPRGAEPLALVEQAADAVERVAAAGWLRPGATVAEYGSPHGGSWLSLLEERGVSPACPTEPADVVLDCFGMMHSADQAAALAERAERVTADGVLLLQFHSLATILRAGQWNALRHGHYAYYSTSVLIGMLAAVGFEPRAAWRFDLYGGTVLLAAARNGLPGSEQGSVRQVLTDEEKAQVRDPLGFSGLQSAVTTSAAKLRSWLEDQRAVGAAVAGYGAASRAVALLCRAGADSTLLPVVADASPAKHGRRMPGTDIEVIDLDRLVGMCPRWVMLFVPDLLAEVKRTLPQIEASGGRWISVDDVL